MSNASGETEQLRERVARLEAARMDAVGRLAESVGQELGDLVAALVNHTKAALDGLPTDSPSRGPLVELEDATRRVADLARRVRTIGQNRVARLELIELNEVVKRFVALVRRALPREIEMDFIPGHELAAITADPDLLDQVLLNLCLNARDALPRGGRITVETENVLINGAYRESHPWAKAGPYVLLTISDDGVGMPPDVRERAFEPFFTTKVSGSGGGLGLSTVYGVVHLHRGLVHLYSEVGRGTTVKVYLPAVARRADSVGPKIDGAVAGGTETILIAEDQEDVLRLVARLLARAGYKVIAARDGAEALQLFSDHIEDVALVLMDVVMPGLDGRAASERIRLLDPDAKILFTSGSTERVVSGSGELSPVVEKPYEPDRLLRMIRGMLDGAIER